MQIFTWRDVETKIERNRELWPASWNRVDVYNDEIVVNICRAKQSKEEDQSTFKDIFGKYYDCEYEEVEIEFDQSKLKIIYEDEGEEERMEKVPAPLFKDIFIQNEEKPALSKLPGTAIAAFHSYKGGVGRTLSLIALANGIAKKYGGGKKVLIVDSDLEAPGLTWMLKQQQGSSAISYLDILSLMHFHDMDSVLAEKIAGLVKKSILVIETDKLETEHYFLPVYREEEQLLDIFSSPEKIISGQNNKYVIAEFLSKIGAALGVDLVLVDLRAGITEFSAPFLFDPRVQKYFVTSTSMQSVKGTQMLLKEIWQRTGKYLSDFKIILTMIPQEMEEHTIGRIEDELMEGIESEIALEDTAFLREDYLLRVLFDSPFISLGDFRQICGVLRGKELLEIMGSAADSIFAAEQDSDDSGLTIKEVRETLGNLHRIASKEITAEGTEELSMLATLPIREIVKDYQSEIPRIVVLGAKGSGKTYLYKQILGGRNWAEFTKSVEKTKEEESCRALVLPLLSTVNWNNIRGLAQECVENANKILGEECIDSNILNINYNEIMSYMDAAHSLTEWKQKWTETIVRTFGGSIEDLEDIDYYLEKQGKKVLFLVDGLEDLFMDAQARKDESWKLAVRALCQNVVNELNSLKHGNVGIIIFARKDLASEAIEINFEQFRNQYFRYELQWTPTEALRLAAWIAARANHRFSENIDILKSNREALEERLELLWGKKLGKNHSKEAFSSRWIIASLSDFNGQLQARDIVRFLKFATENLPDSKLINPDRFIMPIEVRNAIPECSKEKLKEIKDEMKETYCILEKLIKMPDEQKRLPLSMAKLSLTGEEISKLESQGYLVSVEKKYYLPEIIRYAFGFKYEKGARPKVLSLLSN